MKKKSLLLTVVATLGFTASTLAQSVPSYVPTNGLVGWWPFNGNANDESGNGNNGTVNGATLTADRFGNANNAYDFDGSNDFIDIVSTNGLNSSSGISMSMWFNWNGPNGVDNHQYFYLIANNPNGAITVTDAGMLGINVLNCNCVNDLNIETSIISNSWYNVILTYDLSQGLMKLYLNGILINTTQENMFNYFTTNNPADRFGNYHFNSHYFNGQLDEAGLWNRPLNQQEITNLYNSETCANNTSITPQISSLSTGITATFTASTSDPSPSYVWQSDFGQGFQSLNNYGNYSGTNTNALSIANVQLPNHSQPIRVITTSGNCVDTSNIAIINITDTCINTVNDTTFITVTDTLIINTSITGINPPNNVNTIKVFPNPASTHITIDYGNFAIMNGYQLVIENSIGQQVFQTNINQQSDYLSLATWGGNGLYFVHIIDPQGNTIDIRKIVLQ